MRPATFLFSRQAAGGIGRMTTPSLKTEIEIFATRRDAAAAAAETVLKALSEGIARRGFASFAAAGGTTPRDTYRVIARTEFDWSRVAVTVTDDKMVPPNNEESRAGVLGRHLLSSKTRGIRFFPLWSAAANSQTAAFAANDAIRPLAPFDMVLLGMDRTGGVAQLCGQPALPADAMQPHGRRLVVSSGPRGLSLTLAALCSARRATLLIFGDEKLQALNSAQQRNLPVGQLMKQAPLRVLWSA